MSDTGGTLVHQLCTGRPSTLQVTPAETFVSLKTISARPRDDWDATLHLLMRSSANAIIQSRPISAQLSD